MSSIFAAEYGDRMTKLCVLVVRAVDSLRTGCLRNSIVCRQVANHVLGSCTRIFPGTVAILFVTLFGKSLSAQGASNAEPMELRQGAPFVQVMVNGKGPFIFGVDTGTGGEALVCPALAEKLGLPTSGEAEVGDPSGQNRHKVPLYLISSLKVAGVGFKNVK